MEIIVTHELADFDGFAAAVAAQKLYPGAAIVRGRRLGSGLREFMTLHKDRFRTLATGELDQDAVTRLVLVDVRRASRLADFAPLLARASAGAVDVHVYDHHGAADDDVAASLEVVEPVGSATTLLVEALRVREVGIDPVEATLMSLGIHADTGSLTYAQTTARDAVALGWLLDQGVSLPVQRRYLRGGFTPEQRDLLTRVLGSVERVRVAGVGVGFAIVPLEQAFTGFDAVASEAVDLEGLGVLFALFPIAGKRTQVIARSRTPACDVGRVLAELGGGGHAAAGAAVVRDGNGSRVRARIQSLVEAVLPRPRVVADVMSSPVRSVAPELPLATLGESLAVWRHTGVPVLDAGRLVGIVSHRDVERAAREGRLAAPVSSCMTRNVVTAAPATPLSEALATMEEHDVGRLPVLRDGRLVGILSRADALAVLYG